ncbi:MAG: hypothetical protein ACO23O_02655 [Ilumatobacteraceae bacterium]
MWIPITLAAAVFQILRTARQHELRSVLSPSAAGFARYAYGCPMALTASVVVFGVLGRDLPTPNPRFWASIGVAAVAQILATVALLRSFRARDFAIGTVYSKSEVLFVAALGLLGVDELLSVSGWVGTLLVTTGVVWLAADGSVATSIGRFSDPAALLGLGAGSGFAVAAVGIGEASRSLLDAPPFDRALFTLTVLLIAQTLLNAGWFLAVEPAEIARTALAWRPAVSVGLFSLLGSLGWAWGFTLESAAKVRTLGQVELVIAFAVAHRTLAERHTRREHLASALVLVGVVLVAVKG